MVSIAQAEPDVKTEYLYIVVHDPTGLPMIAYRTREEAEECASFARQNGVACHIDHETPMQVHSVKGVGR